MSGVRKMADRWAVSVCPECNGQVWAQGQAHNETCPNRDRIFVPRAVWVMPVEEHEQAMRIADFDATVPVAEMMEQYADHQTWRCGWASYWEDGHCPCGLTKVLDELGVEWVKPADLKQAPQPPNEEAEMTGSGPFGF